MPGTERDGVVIGHHRAVSDPPRELLRTTFEQVPELYDRARPNYPRQIFDDLAALAQLPAQARLVEIGCGTGQATLPLAERGYAITCVELGERLAATAQRRLAAFPSVSVVNANFETWQPERPGFDAVVAFSAFHWLAPDLRYTKTADLLREHGKLGFVSTAHVLRIRRRSVLRRSPGGLRSRHTGRSEDEGWRRRRLLLASLAAAASGCARRSQRRSRDQ